MLRGYYLESSPDARGESRAIRSIYKEESKSVFREYKNDFKRVICILFQDGLHQLLWTE